MASEKQIEANRRNAQLSTGPKTPEGKAISSQNAFDHGLFSSKVLWTGENDEVLNQIRQDLVVQWQPEGATEWIFIDRMAIATYKLNCFENLEERWEASMTNQLFDQRNLQLLWRRQASLERSLNTAFNNLVKFRKLRLAEQKAAAAQFKTEPEPAEVPAQPEPRRRPNPRPPPSWPRHLRNPIPTPPPSRQPSPSWLRIRPAIWLPKPDQPLEPQQPPHP